MSAGKRSLGAVALVVGLAAPHPANADQAAPMGERGSHVQQLVVVPGADRDHVFAVERVLRCDDDCGRVVRAEPATSTWERRSPPGWVGSELAAFAHPSLGAGLFAMGPSGLEVSTDDAATFRPVDRSTGTVRVATHDDGSVSVLVGATDRPAMITYPPLRKTAVSAPDIDRPDIVFHPGYPNVPPGAPAAVASGTHRASGHMAVALCDAALRCSASSIVTPRKDYPRVFLSPAFADDSTMYVAGTSGGLYRSDDGGKTFSQVIVTSGLGPDAVAATAQAVVFSSDFHARRGTGAVYVGVVAVVGKVGGEGRTVGGVYRGGAGDRWSKVGEGGPPDTGVTSLAITRSGSLYVGYIAPPDGGGIVCTSDRVTWRAFCDTKVRREGGPSHGDARSSAAGSTAADGGSSAEQARRGEPGGSHASRPSDRGSRNQVGSGAGWFAGAALAVVLISAAAGALVLRRRRLALVRGRRTSS